MSTTKKYIIKELLPFVLFCIYCLPKKIHKTHTNIKCLHVSRVSCNNICTLTHAPTYHRKKKLKTNQPKNKPNQKHGFGSSAQAPIKIFADKKIEIFSFPFSPHGAVPFV